MCRPRRHRRGCSIRTIDLFTTRSETLIEEVHALHFRCKFGYLTTSDHFYMAAYFYGLDRHWVVSRLDRMYFFWMNIQHRCLLLCFIEIWSFFNTNPSVFESISKLITFLIGKEWIFFFKFPFTVWPHARTVCNIDRRRVCSWRSDAT